MVHAPGQRMFRGSGDRFADKNMRHSSDSNCGSDSSQCVPKIGNIALCEMIPLASFGFVPAFMSYTALAYWKSHPYVLIFFVPL
jgi:uncharacterized protein (DUF779 family)